MAFPGLLQPLGLLALLAIAAVAFVLAYWWHRRRAGRTALQLDVAALSLLALLTGGFFWRVLTEASTVMPVGGGDVASFYYPTYLYAAAEVKRGALPLWNPYLFSGMPLAADVQAAIFYPVNWALYLFVNVDYGSIEWLQVFHYWLAAAFMYLLLRDLGLSRAASLAGGVVFAFCGFMVAHLGHLPMVPTAAWIPAALLALRRAHATRSFGGWIWAILTGGAFAMSFLAGHAQIFSYGLMAVGLLWFYLAATDRPFGWRPLALWASKGALALAVFFGLVAVQFLPGIELSGQSVRSSISYEEAADYSAPPLTLLNLVLPRVYGGNPAEYSPGEWQTTENWGYCGVVALAFAGLGLTRRKRMVGYFALLGALALLLMVGDFSIVHAWVYNFAPGFGSLRSSGRALVLLGLAVAALSAYGIDGLLGGLGSKARDASSDRRTAFWWLAGVTGVVGLVVLFVLPLFYSQLLPLNNIEVSRLPAAINDLGMLVLWLGALAAVGWAAYRARLSTRAMAAVAVLLVVLDLFSPNSRFNPTTESLLKGYQFFQARALVYKFNRDPLTNVPLRIDSDADAQNVWQPSTALLVSSDPEVKLYDTGGAFNPLKLRRYDYLWGIAKRNIDSPLYDLTGARYRIVSPSTVLTNTAKWRFVEAYEGFGIYESANAMPRLYLVHDARVQPDGFSTVESIRSFDVNPRHTVLLESGTGAQSDQPGTAESPAEGPQAESVKATRYTPENISIDVKANAPGWVVLTDAWYPGWDARVDGRTVPVQIAYHAYRAVEVPEGTHTITMEFRPASWEWGRLISLLSLISAAVAIAILAAGARRERRRTGRR